MRRLLLLVVSLFPLAATAQQQCHAGIYMKLGLSPAYASAHVTDSTMVIAFLTTLPLTGIQITLTGYGTAKPAQLGAWEYMTGSWDGTAYRLTGTQIYGACNTVGHVSCDGAGNAYAVSDSVTQTAAGAAWGVNCQKMQSDLVQSGQNTQRWINIF